ncbi:arabinosyltransferase domain-containing protein [Corynebacterium macclintockiae]|uniref:arabinosyltransferase domain-containing protein n=1 Tax=Corynebacterium macclintockiae TaxID=2913501 RepID=UPI003EBCDEF6
MSKVQQPTGKLKLASIISGLIGMVMFLSLPFLPVNQVQSSFNWPQDDDLTSVQAPLISYVPQDVDITVPIKEVRNLDNGATNILSTLPQESTEATLRGLFVRSTDDSLDVVVRNVVPLTIQKDALAKLPDDAKLRITSNYESTRSWVPDAEKSLGYALDSTIDDDVRPALTGIYTDIKNTEKNSNNTIDAGFQAHVTVDSRFTSSPSAIKYLAIFVGIIATAISLYCLHRIDILDKRTTSRRLFHRKWWKPRPLDGVVGFILLAWYFVGANTSDDGYLLTMAKVSHESGYMANYYRWFGVPESPFGSPFYDLLALMTHVTTASIWMRLPSLIAGLVTWLVLSREVMPRLGAKINQRRVAHWTMAATFLLFWMTFNNGTRPEPIIAVLSLLAWVSFERAIATHRLLPAAVGTIIATLALGAGPTGLMAVSALLASLGALIRILTRRLPLLGAPKGAPKKTVIAAILAQIAPFLAAGTAILTAVFADQTLRTVAEAIKLRGAIGPSMHWYDEFRRYEALMEQTVDGSFPRRFTMVMLFFCIGIVIAAMLRNGRITGAAKGPSMRLLLVILGTLFFMTFTPTKWTHHFGVFAGIGAALTALAAVGASRFALQTRRNRILFLGSTLMLFAFTLAGPNGWWYLSSYGVPWWDKPVQISGITASSVVLAISIVVLVWGAIVGFLADAKHARATTESEVADLELAERNKLDRFRGLTAAPIGILTTITVVFTLASMTKGMVSQWPAYSVGKGNVMALTGQSCNQAADVLVETNTNESFLKPADGSSLKDSLTAGGGRGFEPNNIPAKIDAKSSGESQSTVGSADQFRKEESSSDSSTDSNSNDSRTSADRGGAQAAASQDKATNDSDAVKGSSSDSNDASGTTGGLRATKGVNGSYAVLPFGIDTNRVPVVGSFTEGLQTPANTMTSWYSLPKNRDGLPLLVFSVAGRVGHFDMDGIFKYGQEIKVQFGKSGGSKKAEDFKVLGEQIPLDPGYAPEWRNLRIPMNQVPEDADSVRIVANDPNLTPAQWIAITPPRVPEMESLNDYVGSEAPTLLDWTIAFQFPCQKQYDHWAGVAEPAKFRISPDHDVRSNHTPVMDYSGGGSYGLVQMTSQAEEIPTYLKDDWQRDWGVLDKLTPFPNASGDAPKPVKLETETHKRSGLWYNGPMKFSD